VKPAKKAKETEERSSSMKIELGYTTWEGWWQECALCGEGFRAYEVEAQTTLPGEYCMRPVCRRCALDGEQGLKQRLIYRAWELRRLADQLGQACEEGVEVPTLSELHNLERRRGSTAPLDHLDFDES
jgi:hypothetical protein